MNELIINLNNVGIKPSTANGDEIIFDEGYESYEFYDALLKSVKNKLYIYGRKNRKLFTRSNTKIKELIDKNVDLRCLFLSEKSNSSILKAAQENDTFKEDLEKVINGVKQRYDNLDCFRKYDFQQTKRIIILDDVIIYALVSFENGTVKHFTKSNFSVIPANSPLGINLTNEFNKVWNISKPL